MSEADVERLKRTALFKMLIEKEKKEVTEISLEDHEISENIISVVRKAAPLLERIPENMPEFTLHNANHSIHVIENIERIIPYETLEQLNTIEISILIYAAYLHDIGMTASTDERDQIVETKEFKKLLTSNEELYKKFQEAREKDEYRIASDIEKKIFTNFLRINHIQRAHKTIKEYKLDSKISWRGISYCKWVMAVCDSHGLPVKDLYKTEYWPIDALVRDKPVNVQYLSLILRLADILDLDPERTPKHLFYYINSKDEISIKEWEKHLSTTGFWITSDEIKIEAECTNPDYERALRDFIKIIDREREESYYLVLGYRDDLARRYRLNLSKQIKIRIHSKGYEYCEFRFELDYRRVLDLLMGEGLYGDSIVALRELLQNSVDAVRYRESLERRVGNEYTPYIEVSLKNDELIIEDNGIGMDGGIFENYFMKVGRSYYQSLEFREKNVDIEPVSEFGIGILSVFMVAQKFTVESRRKTFEDEFNPSKPIYFEIPTAYDYFTKRPSKRSKYGTKITLYLKPNHPFSAKKLIIIISELAPFIEYPIEICTDNGKETYKPLLPGEKVKNWENAKEYFEIPFDNEIEGIQGKLRVIKPKNRYDDNSRNKFFAQMGFAIPCQELLPQRLFNNIQASINLSGQSKLSLSPSRLDVVKDEKYKKLIGKFQSKILKELEKYLKTSRDSNSVRQYVKIFNELLENNIISLSRSFSSKGFIYEEEKFENAIENIFFNYAPLLIISDNGRRKYKQMKDLDISGCLAITGVNDWPERISDAKILEETKRLIGEKTTLLMYEEKDMWQQSDFLRKILGHSSDFYITSIPGVVIETFQSNEIGKNGSSLLYGGLTYRMHNKLMEKAPLFMHPPGFFMADDTEVIYNANHPLFARLLNGDKPKDKASLEAIRLLTSHIEECLSNLYNRLYSPYFRRHNGLENTVNINYFLIGVLKYYPEILQELYEAVELYCVKAKNLGVIPIEEEFIGFSLDDLPWFWNCELSDYKFE
jgi:molecular chaperone HtpG